MNVSSIPSVPGAQKRRKRVGRGIGSGHGKTSTRGQKGQRARTGEGKRPGFEGGRSPLIRRLPKRGFRRKATGREPIREILNVDQLNRFSDGQHVTPEALQEAGLIHDRRHTVKLLGDGTLSKRLTIVVHHVSEGAKAKVLQAGGSIEPLTPVSSSESGVPNSTRHSTLDTRN
ncbi:MAG: 50S ribosomal protein L15 [Candidatus Omnitrophica bacterium]|nr:50S ribosomal protein L15 [Candidatus Omnitrophota bacterium]